MERFLEPEWAEFYELVRALQGSLPIPHLSRVDQNIHVVARSPSRFSNESDIGRLVPAHRPPAELDGGEPLIGEPAR